MLKLLDLMFTNEYCSNCYGIMLPNIVSHINSNNNDSYSIHIDANNEYNAYNVFIETQIVDFIICDINIEFIILPEKLLLENISVLITLHRRQIVIIKH